MRPSCFAVSSALLLWGGLVGCDGGGGRSDPPVCGDGVREGDEGCDGDDLGGVTCSSLGVGDGQLACTDACQLDASGCDAGGDRCGPASCAGCCDSDRVCQNGTEVSHCGVGGQACAVCGGDERCVEGGCLAIGCGDGIVDEGESCDGEDLEGQSCESLGLGAGDLSCFEDCTLDMSGCDADPCERAEALGTDCHFCLDGVGYLCGFCHDGGEDHLLPCGEGLECYLLDTTYPECRRAGETPCDDGAFESRCEGVLLVGCDGGYTRTTDCVEVGFDDCVVNLEGRPICVPEDAELCDDATYEPWCDADDYVYCHENGYVTRERCDATCVVTGRGPSCVEEGTRACAEGEDERCDGAYAFTCDTVAGWEARIDCSMGGDVCRLRGEPARAVCADADADECDPFVLTCAPIGCDEGMMLDCCSGFEAHWPCPEDGEVCFPSSDPLALVDRVCLPDDVELCDASTEEPTCDGDEAVNCFGYRSRERCDPPNDLCTVLPGSRALCTFDGAEPCEEPPMGWTGLYCADDSAVVVCTWLFIEQAIVCPSGCRCDDTWGAQCLTEGGGYCDWLPWWWGL